MLHNQTTNHIKSISIELHRRCFNYISLQSLHPFVPKQKNKCMLKCNTGCLNPYFARYARENCENLCKCKQFKIIMTRNSHERKVINDNQYRYKVLRYRQSADNQSCNTTVRCLQNYTLSFFPFQQ